MTFSENYLATIWCNMSLPIRDLTCPRQWYFDRHVFQNFYFSSCKIKQKLSCGILKPLEHFMVFLFVLITFQLILDGFWGFGQIQKSKMADPDGPIPKWLRNYYVMWRHHFMMWTSKETFLDILPTLQVSLSSLLYSRSYGGAAGITPTPGRRRPNKAWSK